MRNNVNSIWTDDVTTTLRRLWAAGISFSEIASEIGTTRNAVGGKLFRLELTGRATVNRIYGRRTPEQIEATKREKAARRNERRRTQRVSIVKPAINLEALRCVEVDPQHKSLLDLDPTGCRYPLGDGPFTFCNHPQFEGSSYCGPHMALSRRGGGS